MFLSMNVALGSVVKQRLGHGPTTGIHHSRPLALLTVYNSCRDSDSVAYGPLTV